MRLDPEVAERYGEALFATARRRQTEDQLLREASEVLRLLQKGSDFRRFLEGPQFNTDEQRAVVERVFRVKYSELLVNLLDLLIRRRRIFYLEMILKEFERLVEEERGIFPAEVVSATTIEEDQRRALSNALEQYTNHTLKISFRTDPRLIGGLIFKFRDLLIDDSIKTRLDEMQHRLLAARL